ncbi:MAG: winged helix-turn-helix transcriptional regulator [Bacteroidetes bacterium]|nr:winged helix-turn-helix transcriptional regulator [Bacteroidota bacterium]
MKLPKASFFIAAILALGLFVWRMLEWQFLGGRISTFLYTSIAVLLAIAFGVLFGYKQFRKTKVVVVNDKTRINPNAMMQSGLSKRETEILLCLERDLSNKEIADELFISVPTIKTHTSKLYTKLEVSNRNQAVKRALEISAMSPSAV